MAVYYDNTPKVSLAEASPLAFCIEVARQEQKLFDAVLEADFIQVYSEHGLILLEGADEGDQGAAGGESKSDKADKATANGIFGKIKEMVTQAIDAIKKFFAGLWAKVKDFFDKDLQALKKYKDAVAKADFTKDYKNAYVPAEGVTSYDTKLNAMKDAMRGIVDKALSSDFDDSEIKVEDTFVPAKEDSGYNEAMVNIVKTLYIDGKYTELKKKFDIVEKEEIAKIKEAAAKAQGNAKENNEEFKKIAKVSKSISKFNTVYSKATAKVLADARKEFINMGKFAVKQTSGAKADDKTKEGGQQTNTEATLESFFIDFATDQYVESMFSLA